MLSEIRGEYRKLLQHSAMSDKDSSLDRPESPILSEPRPETDQKPLIPSLKVEKPIRSRVLPFHIFARNHKFPQESLSLYRIPLAISNETVSRRRKTRDADDRPDFLKAILAFFQVQGVAINWGDVVSLPNTRDLFSPERYHQIIALLSWRSHPSPRSIFSSLRLGISCGRKTNTRIWSYTKVDFPVGRPMTSGRRREDRRHLNDLWVACEYQCDDSRKRTCSNISQVSSDLEQIENDQAALDTQIVRNRNALRHFLTCGNPPGFPSQMIHQELTSVYGVHGPLLLEFLLIRPAIVFPIILRRLRERYRALCIQKLRCQSRLAVELGKLLPRQSVKHQPIPGPREEVIEFSMLGLQPTSYRVEDTRFLTEFFDFLEEVAWKHQSSGLSRFESCVVCVRDIVGDLRSQRLLNKASPYAVALLVCATLLKKLEICADVDAADGVSLAIPLAIGLTHPGLHGHLRLLRIAAESIVTRRWADGVTEISGMFPNINLSQAAVLLRTFDLTWKCVANAVSAPTDLPGAITINIGAGVVTLSRRDDPACSFSIDLMQYSQW
jgi:hypothetical protein